MSADFDLSKYTLYERQSMFYNGSRCPYCIEYADFVDSIIVYKQSYGMIFYCEKCKAWVGTKSNSDQSLGVLAKKPLRDLRNEVHKFFDPLVQTKILKGSKVKKAQSDAYGWMSKILGIKPEEAHIAYLNMEQCKSVIAECEKVQADNARKREDTIWRTQICEFLAGEIGYEVKTFSMNNTTQIEMVNHNGKKLIYNPRTQEGRWDNEKKMHPINDIEKYIYSNFKP